MQCERANLVGVGGARLAIDPAQQSDQCYRIIRCGQPVHDDRDAASGLLEVAVDHVTGDVAFAFEHSDGVADVRRLDVLPIEVSRIAAHGERELTRFTTRDFMNNGSIRYVMFDGTRYAGFTESLRVAHMADHAGVMITPHHAPELHCHLVAAFPRTGFAVESHGSDDRDPIWHGLFSDRAQVRDSYVYMNDKPGFGIEIDWGFAKRYGGYGA